MDGRAPSGHNACDIPSGLTPGVRLDRFRSRDLDETGAYLGARFGDRSRVVPRAAGPFFYGHVVVDSGRAAVGRVRTLLPQIMRATAREPTLYLPLRAGDAYRIGRRTLQAGPMKAVVLAPGHEYTCRSPANEWLGLVVSGDLLRDEILARRRGRSRTWLFRSVEIPLTADRRAELMGFYRRARDLGAARAVDATKAALDPVERDIAAWLAGMILGQRGEVRISAPSLRRFERLERWVDAHLGETLTLDRLCAISGVRWRTLQKSVMALRGQSPLEWIAARRLAAVRARLLSRPSGATVSSVALDFGFTHLGRFSATYQQTYGELPSETLEAARSKRAAGLPPAS